MEIEDEKRYVDEFGRPLAVWRPKDPDKRNKFKTFFAAAESALKGMLKEENPFFDSLVDSWAGMFPELPARPGRHEDGKIVLYVPNAPLLFAVRPRLGAIKKRLQALAGAPKKIELILEIRK